MYPSAGMNAAAVAAAAAARHPVRLFIYKKKKNLIICQLIQKIENVSAYLCQYNFYHKFVII